MLPGPTQHSSSSPDGAGPRMQQLWNHRWHVLPSHCVHANSVAPRGRRRRGGSSQPQVAQIHSSSSPSPLSASPPTGAPASPPPPPSHSSRKNLCGPPDARPHLVLRQGKNSCWPPECASHVGRAHARVIESITPCERGAATGRCGRAAGSGGVRWRPDLTLHTLRPLYGVGSGVRRAGRERGGCSLQNPRFGGLRGRQTHRPDG